MSRELALAEFTEYFVHNYPGPNTIIMDPRWHAPKIFRAAERALLATPAQTPSEPVAEGEVARMCEILRKCQNEVVDGRWKSFQDEAATLLEREARRADEQKERGDYLMAQLSKSREHHVEWCRLHSKEVEDAHRLRMSAEAERDEAVRDAERYRFIRGNAAWEDLHDKPGHMMLYDEALDAALDAAMLTRKA